MSSLTFIFVLVAILAILFLVLNSLLAPRDPNTAKESPFECGFSAYLGQNRAHFDVQFFLVALVYLLLDLEILIIYPFAMSGRENGVYGLIIVLIIISIITVGFIFELGKKALSINSRQKS